MSEDIPVIGASLDGWTAMEGVSEDCKFLFSRLQQYGIAVLIDGSWVDKETGKRLTMNHVVCMLRREYIEAGFKTLAGKQLVKYLHAFLNGIVNNCYELIKENKGTKKLMQLDEGFL